MDINDVDDEEFGFSRNYFLAKELGSSGKKSTHRLSDIDVVPEEVFLKLLESACFSVCISFPWSRTC